MQPHSRVTGFFDTLRLYWYMKIVRYPPTKVPRLITKRLFNLIVKSEKVVPPNLHLHPARKDKERDNDNEQQDRISSRGKLDEVMGKHDPSRPIVFIHYGKSDYLKYSLGQAKKANPKSTTYLIGDSLIDIYDLIEHRFISDYSQGAQYFRNIYRHFNETNYEYELFNFQRWFILKEFMVGNDLNNALYLDSDVMLYADIGIEQEKFNQYSFTLSRGHCGCVCFINNVEALGKFCQFLIDIYSKKDRYHYDKMLSHYVVRKMNQLPGGACDMTALELFSKQEFGNIGEVSHIIDGSTYDININISDPGFEMDEGIKKIIWRENVPYGIHLRTGKEIKYNSLHFQGRAKKLMRQFCQSD